jgi:hypothetical protein
MLTRGSLGRDDVVSLETEKSHVLLPVLQLSQEFGRWILPIGTSPRLRVREGGQV